MNEGLDPNELIEGAVVKLAGCTDQGERYDLLCALLAELATTGQAGHNGRGGDSDAHLQTAVADAGKKLQAAQEENAGLKDALGLCKADLENREKHLETEKKRTADLERRIEEERKHLRDVEAKLAETESRLTETESERHANQVRSEELELALQRKALAGQDTSRGDALADENIRLNQQIEALRKEIDQLRTEKNAELENLRGALRQAEAGRGQDADTLLERVWDQLARANPPLAKGAEQPNPQSVERLVDALIALFGFAHHLDHDLRAVLDKCAKHEPAIKNQWKAYAAKEDFHKVLSKTLDPATAMPPAVLRMKLDGFKRFVNAAMLAGDSTLEWIGPELESHLLGPDRNRKRPIADYLSEDGHERFAQHMRAFRSRKYAELFRGV